MNLMMFSGDTALVQGRRGPFHTTLSEFHTCWDHIDILVPPVANAVTPQPFPNITLHPTASADAIHTARPLIAAHRPDLLLSHDYGLFRNGRAAARLAAEYTIPWVSEIHHVEGYPRAAVPLEHLRRWLTRRFIGWATPRALGFRVPNQHELPPLLQSWGVPAAKIRVLHSLYLDLATFTPAPTDLTYDAIWVGRFVPNKAPHLFIAACAEAARQVQRPVRALLIGDGPLRTATLQAAAQHPLLDLTHIPWLDNPADLADYYRQSRCLLCTSFSEGGPRVVGEALACGTPVITTRIGLAAELVQPGQNGFHADWSAADLGAKLAMLLADPGLQHTLRANAPAAVQSFEKTRVIRAYAEGLQAWLTAR